MTAHAFGMVNVTSAFIAPKLLTAKAKEEAIPSGWGYLSSSRGYLLNPFILIFDRNLEPKTTDRPPFSMEAQRAFWGKILSSAGLKVRTLQKGVPILFSFEAASEAREKNFLLAVIPVIVLLLQDFCNKYNDIDCSPQY